ncbi:MAG: PD-(D/E)XK motif protein [Acidimicrobiaceae bacterium]|nr:PD-(D/E)XK motif protein [Acidimicrobiaceae bacterium]
MREDPWSSVPRPAAGLLRAREPSEPNGVWYGWDDQGRRHLLLPVPSDHNATVDFETRGLIATVRQLHLDEGPDGTWVDIGCLDGGSAGAFAALARELNEQLAARQRDVATVVSEVLERWRRFWLEAASPGLLDPAAELGLIGELWFLLRWLGAAASVRHWTGPLGDRHDFVTTSVSVEAKTASVRGGEMPTHPIAHLDQLADPVNGSLMLFSLGLARDADGDTTLPGLVAEAESLCQGTPHVVAWRERIHAAGWRPPHGELYTRRFRVVSQQLYRVDDQFPRLVRSSFNGGQPPAGVGDIRYSVTPSVVSGTHVLASEPQGARSYLSPFETAME